MSKLTTSSDDQGARFRELPDAASQPTVTVVQAAAILGISRGVAYDAARRGLLPTLRVGRRILVPTARLAALLSGEATSNASRAET